MDTNSTSRDAFKDPNIKAALGKYDPNAGRNRLPTKFDNEAKPYVRFCQARNVSTYNFLSGSVEPGYNTYRTTSQNFFDYDPGMLAVGESNQGIVSEKVRWVHVKQTS